MTDYSLPPALFPWRGRTDVPGEVVSVLRLEAKLAREKRGDSGDVPQGFCREGVEQLAIEQHERLEKERAEARGKKSLFRETDAEAKQWCYLLHAYCAASGQSAPEPLLWLTFSVLDQSEGQINSRVASRINYPNVKDLDAWLRASYLDGLADAIGSKITEEKLQDLVNIDRRTLRRWRQQRQYRSRRAFQAEVALSHSDLTES